MEEGSVWNNFSTAFDITRCVSYLNGIKKWGKSQHETRNNRPDTRCRFYASFPVKSPSFFISSPPLAFFFFFLRHTSSARRIHSPFSILIPLTWTNNETSDLVTRWFCLCHRQLGHAMIRCKQIDESIDSIRPTAESFAVPNSILRMLNYKCKFDIRTRDHLSSDCIRSRR